MYILMTAESLIKGFVILVFVRYMKIETDFTRSFLPLLLSRGMFWGIKSAESFAH